MSFVDKAEISIIKAYYDLFGSRYGDTVLDDLKETFIERLNEEYELEIEKIPHPFQEYVRKGERNVIKAIEAAIKLGGDSQALKQLQKEDDLDETTQDGEEIL